MRAHDRSSVSRYLLWLAQRGQADPQSLARAVAALYRRAIARSLAEGRGNRLPAQFFSGFVLTAHSWQRQGQRRRIAFVDQQRAVAMPLEIRASAVDPTSTISTAWIPAGRDALGYWLTVPWVCDARGQCVVKTAFVVADRPPPTARDIARYLEDLR